MNDKLLEEVNGLLSESELLITQGKLEESLAKIDEIKKKLRPVGTGTNGPEPKQ